MPFWPRHLGTAFCLGTIQSRKEESLLVFFAASVPFGKGRGGRDDASVSLFFFLFHYSRIKSMKEEQSQEKEGGGERAKAVLFLFRPRERETDMMDVERGGGRQTQGVSKRFRTRSANFLGLLCFVSLALLGRRTGELIRGDFWKKLSCLHGCKSQAGFS